MKYNLFDKVVTQNMDGKFNNVPGTIMDIYTNIDVENVYTVKYDNLIGGIGRGMFKESDLKLR